jgi:hypothetical protein
MAANFCQIQDRAASVETPPALRATHSAELTAEALSRGAQSKAALF